MPPSRPVSSRRVPEDDPESILVHSYLMPKNIDEARTLSRAALHEVIGYIVVTALLLALGISSLVIWISSYVVPYGTYVLAECLVLNSTQTMLPEGFLRQPLYRAEVYIYVFNTSNPECCCQDLYGRNRCAEWEALAYDNILETHTAGSKVEFLRQYGYPGTFHKCWHSPGKDKVLMDRSSNSTFLIVPAVGFMVGGQEGTAVSGCSLLHEQVLRRSQGRERVGPGAVATQAGDAERGRERGRLSFTVEADRASKSEQHGLIKTIGRGATDRLARPDASHSRLHSWAPRCLFLLRQHEGDLVLVVEEVLAAEGIPVLGGHCPRLRQRVPVWLALELHRHHHPLRPLFSTPLGQHLDRPVWRGDHVADHPVRRRSLLVPVDPEVAVKRRERERVALHEHHVLVGHQLRHELAPIHGRDPASLPPQRFRPPSRTRAQIHANLSLLRLPVHALERLFQLAVCATRHRLLFLINVDGCQPRRNVPARPGASRFRLQTPRHGNLELLCVQEEKLDQPPRVMRGRALILLCLSGSREAFSQDLAHFVSNGKATTKPTRVRCTFEIVRHKRVDCERATWCGPQRCCHVTVAHQVDSLQAPLCQLLDRAAFHRGARRQHLQGIRQVPLLIQRFKGVEHKRRVLDTEKPWGDLLALFDSSAAEFLCERRLESVSARKIPRTEGGHPERIDTRKITEAYKDGNEPEHQRETRGRQVGHHRQGTTWGKSKRETRRSLAPSRLQSLLQSGIFSESLNPRTRIPRYFTLSYCRNRPKRTGRIARRISQPETKLAHNMAHASDKMNVDVTELAFSTTYTLPAPVDGVAARSDGTVVVATSRVFGNEWDGGLTAILPSGTQKMCHMPCGCTDVAFVGKESNAVVVSCDDGNVIVVSITSIGAEGWRPLSLFAEHEHIATAVGVCPSAPETLASASFDHTVKVWSMGSGDEGGCTTSLTGHCATVWDVEYSPSDANVLASCAQDGGVRVWDQRKVGCTSSVEEESALFCLTWKDENTILAGSENGTIHTYDLRKIDKGEFVKFQAHTDSVRRISVLAGEKDSLVASVGDDCFLAVSSPDAGILKHKSKPHTDYVRGLCALPDKSGLLTASWDKTVATVKLP